MSKQLHNKVNKEELRRKIAKDETERTTLSFYQYAKISNPKLFRDHLYLELSKIDVLGRVYIASEGINGQVSIPQNNVTQLREVFENIEFLSKTRLNFAIEDGISL